MLGSCNTQPSTLIPNMDASHHMTDGYISACSSHIPCDWIMYLNDVFKCNRWWAKVAELVFHSLILFIDKACSTPLKHEIAILLWNERGHQIALLSTHMSRYIHFAMSCLHMFVHFRCRRLSLVVVESCQMCRPCSLSTSWSSLPGVMTPTHDKW